MTTDSRKAGKGSLYIAIRGVNADGHDFIGEALSRGAAAIAVSDAAAKAAGEGIPVITVSDTRRLASRMFAAFYGGDEAGEPHKTKLIAVTGTNGKTTVTHMIRHILAYAGYSVGLIGTVGITLGRERYDTAQHMTTPPPEEFYRVLWDMIRSDTDYIVFEASSHGIAQERLAGLDILGCELAAAVFTNLTPEHMDYHTGMEDYFAVKSRMFSEFGAKIKIINTSDAYGRRLYGLCPEGAVAVDTDGIGGGTVYPHGSMMLGAAGVQYMYTSDSAVFPVRCGVPGRYTVANSIEALACTTALGIDAVTARDAIGTFGGVRGRMERVRCDTTKFTPPVFIDFAHTPAALEGLLHSVRETAPDKRLVLLFGCGGDRDRTKRAVMGRIATALSDYTIITSDNSRGERADDIIAEILLGVPASAPHTVITDRASAIEYAVMNATPCDIIILAGKGHEDYDDSGGVRRHFDEREIVAAAIEKRYGSMGAV